MQYSIGSTAPCLRILVHTIHTNYAVFFRDATKATREGWPLLTVETEENGDSKSTNERGPSLVGSLGS
jgi:hypothetical protein